MLVLDENLFWTSRLGKGLEALGHETVALAEVPEEWPDAEVAVVNLGSQEFEPRSTVAALREKGIKVVGHAGHKEGTLLGTGEEAGCELVVTNSELTFKLEQILARLNGDASTK